MMLIRKSRRSILSQAVTLPVVAFFLGDAVSGEDTRIQTDTATLTEINQGYLASYRTGDAQWFDAHLSEDFRETAPDGTILNKPQFLQKIRQRVGGSAEGVQAAELEIRLFDDLAVIHGIPESIDQDGSRNRGGRYTDVYYRIADRWLCVAAHLGGSVSADQD